MPIGGWQIEKNRTFDTYSLKLEDNAKLYFFSDGLKHQFDADNQKKFSRKRLLNLLTYSANFPMEEQQELLEFVFEDWKGDTKQTDDVSLIGIEF
ncbi:MAG: SpoIIE family protein phosphatase [Bacteroidetes bacterium]|nr:SpoIIE family protein phosphatase [Bacteroidota bacterium]